MSRVAPKFTLICIEKYLNFPSFQNFVKEIFLNHHVEKLNYTIYVKHIKVPQLVCMQNRDGWSVVIELIFQMEKREIIFY
jgi:hypothetical protein